jgi:hypothetical protein
MKVKPKGNAPSRPPFDVPIDHQHQVSHVILQRHVIRKDIKELLSIGRE